MSITIKGKIRFASPPLTIPDGSLLKVKFQDTGRMDAPSIDLGVYEKVIEGYKTGDEITYEIKCNRPNCFGTSMSAVLNIGWKASGSEWIRKGDHLNDTHHDIDVGNASQVVFEKDIEINHYK